MNFTIYPWGRVRAGSVRVGTGDSAAIRRATAP